MKSIAATVSLAIWPEGGRPFFRSARLVRTQLSYMQGDYNLQLRFRSAFIRVVGFCVGKENWVYKTFLYWLSYVLHGRLVVLILWFRCSCLAALSVLWCRPLLWPLVKTSVRPGAYAHLISWLRFASFVGYTLNFLRMFVTVFHICSTRSLSRLILGCFHQSRRSWVSRFDSWIS